MYPIPFGTWCIIVFVIIFNVIALLIPESYISEHTLAFILGIIDGLVLLWLAVNYTNLFPPYNDEHKTRDGFITNYFDIDRK